MKILRGKAALISAVFSFLMIGWCGGTAVALASEVTIQTGFNYEWLDSGKDTDARQFSIPIRMDARLGDFVLGALTAYSSTTIKPEGEDNRTLSTILDTKIMSSYEIIGKMPVDVIIGVDLNLPTGKTNLTARQLGFVLDSDLIGINNFGEGFNVNPTLTVAKEWEGGAAGVGVGYLFRGEYDYSSELGMDDYDPGDVANVALELHQEFSEHAFGRLFGSYLWFGEDKAGGRKIYQEGVVPIAGLGLGYKGEKWNGAITARGIFRDSSKYPDASGALRTEDKNSHGTEWIADLSMKYRIDDKTTLSGLLRGLMLSENDYAEGDARYIGKVNKVSLGLQLGRILSETFDAAVIVKGFFMHADEANFPEHREAQDYKGASGGIQLTARF